MSIYNIFLGTVGKPPDTAPIVATGGTETTVGNYKYHTFTGSGTFTVTSAPSGLDLAYIVVAGGGAGGNGFAGGGAGGFIYGTLNPSVTSYTITIGAGAASQTTAGNRGATGSDSSAFGYTAKGGGGGGGSTGAQQPGGNGGSGGGKRTTTDGLGTLGQGTGAAFAGGCCCNPGAPGGGGALSSPFDVNGGYGVNWFNDATGFAGGGGGFSSNGPSPAYNGGGAGQVGTGTPGSGTANTGGGGGGSNGKATGAGGSGVVVIRYPIAGVQFNADILIVGGGGCGADGGGGAGGYLAVSSHSLTSGTTYTATVGAGGTYNSYSTLQAPISSFDGMIAAGGGQGWDTSNRPNNSGGSSQGSIFTSASSGYLLPPVLNQGNKGAYGTSGTNAGSGGGGGAGAAGSNAAATSGGAGGNGSTWLDGNTYCGGGGGGGYGTWTGGAGGTGGGGTGASVSTASTAGSANTGGAGGASGGGGRAGSSGGSGIVIIRYSNTLPDAASTTGSPTYTNTGGYKYYKFTGSGTITW